MSSTRSKAGSRFACAAVFAVVTATAASAAPAGDAAYTRLPSAKRLAADIDAIGPDAVLHDRLRPASPVFDALFAQIETGRPDWLRIATVLHSASDAGASEGLSAALTVAIARHPHDVLRALAGGPVAEVCSARFAFIEQPGAAQRWRAQAVPALMAEHDASVASVRDACLAALPPAQ